MRRKLLENLLVLLSCLVLFSSCGKGNDKAADIKNEAVVAAGNGSVETSASNDKDRASSQKMSSTGKFTNVGGNVLFGLYEQDGNYKNGPEPIEWTVLDVQNEKCLLISRYGLDTVPYNESGLKDTWDTCTLRSWLNEEFLNLAFNGNQKSAILETRLDNSLYSGYVNKDKYSKWKTDESNPTKDRIFLLSYKEAHDYLQTEYQVKNRKACCAPTSYAIMNEATKQLTEDGLESGRWWLRTSVKYYGSALYIDYSGETGYYSVNGSDVCARPALWLDLTSDYISKVLENASETPSTKPVTFVAFGHYEQDNNPDNGPEPIEWIVLEEKDGKALLMSRYGLDRKAYAEGNASSLWEGSTIRKWLNDKFLTDAFTEDEMTIIQTTEVDNGESQGNNSVITGNSRWITDGGNNTKDCIFLLSVAEASKYLGATPKSFSIMLPRMEPTAYASIEGKEVRHSYYTMDGNRPEWWWLRSPGSIRGEVAKVGESGVIDSLKAGLSNGLVRPVLWVDLETGKTKKVLTTYNFE